MFSTAGVPPFVGFWAKLQIIQALLGSGHLALAIVAVVASVIGAFYYLRVVWLMYFEAPGAAGHGESRRCDPAGAGRQCAGDPRARLAAGAAAGFCRTVIPGRLTPDLQARATNLHFRGRFG